MGGKRRFSQEFGMKVRPSCRRGDLKRSKSARIVGYRSYIAMIETVP